MSDSCCPPPKNDSPCCPPAEEPLPGCCPAPATDGPCCPPVADDRPGYRLWPFVCGWIDHGLQSTPRVATRLTCGDIIGRWQMRWGLGRSRYTIAPGLYAVGSPNAESPVLVTANYKMTFDVLRRDLHGLDAWLLVLNTCGINVWCAAGKGTFGTEEIIRRVEQCGLHELVNHRTLIVPQLGAPGVAAHKVSKGCGFKVVYGPVRSADLPVFLQHDLHATADMRRVSFSLVERLVLTPVELVNMRKQFLYGALILFILGGIGPQIFSFAAALQRGGSAIAAGLAGLLAGAVVTPALLPWLPGRAFAIKGAVAGLATGLLGVLLFAHSLEWLNAMALIVSLAAVASWCGMHFTGSSTYTSPSGVEKEMRQAIPAQAAALLVALLCWLATAF